MGENAGSGQEPKMENLINESEGLNERLAETKESLIRLVDKLTRRPEPTESSVSGDASKVDTQPPAIAEVSRNHSRSNSLISQINEHVDHLHQIIGLQ